MFGKVSNHNRHGFFRFVSIALSVVMIALLAVGCAPKNEQVVENGLSAYEIAVQYGYGGSIEEWLESLHGKSAYDIAVDNGFAGRWRNVDQTECISGGGDDMEDTRGVANWW